MNGQLLWNLMRETWSVLGQHFEPIIETIVADSGLETRTWGLLLAVLTFEPDHTTPAHLMVRGPYTAAESYLARLEAAAEMGYLSEVAEGEFYLTPAGRAETQRFIERARHAMVAALPAPGDSVIKLAHYLDQLVRSCLNTQPPPDIWSIRLSHRLMPPIDSPLPFIEQSFSCLAAYRDDAHLAAWQASGLTATAMEALTFIWRAQVDSLDGLVEHLAQRGHHRQVYVDAVSELRKRIFVTSAQGRLHITKTGQHFRDQVESDTDQYFFKPWAVLKDPGTKDLERLLLKLRDELRRKNN